MFVSLYMKGWGELGKWCTAARTVTISKMESIHYNNHQDDIAINQWSHKHTNNYPLPSAVLNVGPE